MAEGVLVTVVVPCPVGRPGDVQFIPLTPYYEKLIARNLVRVIEPDEVKLPEPAFPRETVVDERPVPAESTAASEYDGAWYVEPESPPEPVEED